MTDTPPTQAEAEAAMYRLGEVVWHVSEEGGLPDVGISVGLGDAMLYAGEVPGAGVPRCLVIYPMTGERQLVAHLVPDGDDDPARDLIERLGQLLRPVPPEPVAGAAPVTDAVRDVLAERKRQISDEGWTPEHDDAYQAGDLANAAACYLKTDPVMGLDRPAPVDWPWSATWWKPTSRRRDLVKGIALGIAEVERLDRAALAQKGSA
jgi:hypothetical protein